MSPESAMSRLLEASPSPSSIYLNLAMNMSLGQVSPSSSSTPPDLGANINNSLSFDGTDLDRNALALTTGNDPVVQPLNWGMLGLTVIIVCTAVGNLLVCLAVCWEKRLQNMTNYFLMSLAIADFLVSLLVMPLGMVVEMFGKLSVLK